MSGASSTEEQKLRRSEAVYMHDFVTCDEGGSGVVVGISRAHGEVLVLIYENGEPTMRIKTVDMESLEQHPDGREN